ncbi:PEP-CTERM sorting domain-containing protein [Pseudoduganella namucuonensis]|uniref:PEP-CTERM protein-sorting domain-containing protein n=1 Tax=Pseudoduganella namucuonensis TaxID=1035707 RepID=A0A1I7LNK0_9BURK|nr:PEP-CTERM sorting domain-containing protein [Pseudoduganella namucuonensis]SFV11258.1 PEP-CTERM protein-sorting domain-containing protein [Pseudoduganella namucuonensis]
MKTTLKKMLLALLLGACSATSSAGVINFDDLSGDFTEAIAGGYQGLNWDNVGSIRSDAFPGSGYEAGTVSQANTAYNRDGGAVAISKAGAGTFNFVGAFFTSAWVEQEISFEGYLDGQLTHSSATSFVLDTTTPLWVQLGWSGIDTLLIYNSSGTQWAMDDMKVPEPASLALFGAGAMGLMLARRRKLPAR